MKFSQVREDPKLELIALNNIIESNANILCICSGGCNIMSLLTEDNIKHIDGIDINKEQIYLTELKIALFEHFDLQQYINIIEGSEQRERDYYINLLNTLHLNEDTKRYWMDHITEFAKGINTIGKFEEIFRDLIDSHFDFDIAFDKNKLIEKFGVNAVINSNSVSFADHFRLVLKRLEILSNPDENYFYHQILTNKYNMNDLPLYMHNKQKVIENLHKLTLIGSEFTSYLQNTYKKYHIISASNITDWMSVEKIKELLLLIDDKLESNGAIIMRRLNGDYDLRKIISDTFGNKFNVIYLLDKSCFYNESIIAFRL